MGRADAEAVAEGGGSSVRGCRLQGGKVWVGQNDWGRTTAGAGRAACCLWMAAEMRSLPG